MEITQSGQQMENQMKNRESNVRDLWDDIKWGQSMYNRESEREEKEKGIENIFEEITCKNFPNLKETYQDTGTTEGPK